MGLEMECSIDKKNYNLGEAKWHGIGCGVVDFLQNIECVIAPLKCHAFKINGGWIRPELGTLKFNVDGSAIGKLGLAGLERVLRNHEETVQFVSRSR
ncbi:hypothetical protein PTKIN_Ptkin05aG0128600 [Pterospermum kingtungense]